MRIPMRLGQPGGFRKLGLSRKRQAADNAEEADNNKSFHSVAIIKFAGGSPGEPALAQLPAAGAIA